MGDQMYGKCDVCGKEGPLQRTYFRYPIKCECHSPEHFYSVDHHRECDPKEPGYQKIEFKTVDLKNPIPIALDILRAAFKDKEPGSYYHGWVSNIACCIMDQYSYGEENHAKANKAAREFLNLLIKE